MKSFGALAILLIGLAPAFAGENLRLNSKLDCTSDSPDRPLITGEGMEEGFSLASRRLSFCMGKAATTPKGRRAEP